jgi:hypothetical protein
VVSFLQVSPPKPCIHLSSPPYTVHGPPISFFSILSPERYWVRSADHSALHYVTSSTLQTVLSDFLNLVNDIHAIHCSRHKIQPTITLIYLTLQKVKEYNLPAVYK